MRPENPRDEPKRTKHIDGSNGSSAPGIFTMVKSPKQDEVFMTEPSDGLKRRSASTDCLYFTVDPEAVEKKSFWAKNPSTPNLYVEGKAKFERKCLSCKSAPPAYPENICVESRVKPARATERIRKCIACTETRTGSAPPIFPETRAKEEYKMAFKAGIPGNEGRYFDVTRGVVKLPKQKDPYAKRNYDINSLSAPFNVVKEGVRGTGYRGYPEHCRLASVYQHSYKPIEARKRRLLKVVYQ